MGRLCKLLFIVTSIFTNGFPTEAWFMSTQGSCYRSPNVGCFPVAYPFNNTFTIEPEAPADISVAFTMKRRGLPSRTFNAQNTSQRLNRFYQPSQKTVVLIHGYLESCNMPWLDSMTNELLEKEPMNVICVDWSWGAGNFLYIQSVANTRMVGALLALVLQDLVSLGSDMSTFHLIGYSLGAHVAGQTGKRLNGLGRITGLDPAGPYFDGVHPDARLHSDDAMLVDVLHTDANPPIGAGAVQPMGDVDFYVNGGRNQPGCYSAIVNRISFASSRLFLSSLRNSVICNHHRAIELFESTIRGNCNFPAFRCAGAFQVRHIDCIRCTGNQSCPNMGYNLDINGVSSNMFGIFRSETTGSRPFC